MSFVYFTDRDLGLGFAKILREAGLAVERHTDHFDPQTPDPEWLEIIGKRRWIALAHDRRIRYKPNERDAVIEHNVGLLVLVGAALYSELATSFLATLSRIEHFLAQYEPPFIAKVYRASPAEKDRSASAPGRIEYGYP